MKQTNMMKLIGVVGITTATAFMGAGEAHAVSFALDLFDQPTIDNNDGSTDLEATGLGSTDSGVASGVGVNFADRQETLTVTEINQAPDQSRSEIKSGRLQIQNDDGNIASSTLRYDNIGGFDFVQGSSGAGIRFGSEDTFTKEFGRVQDVKFTDINGDTATAGIKDFAGNEFVFYEFANEFSGSTIFEQINSVEFTLTADPNATSGPFTPQGQNLRFDQVISITDDPNNPSTNPPPVPTPFEAETSAALALLGAWGAWKYWKRRKQQQVQFDNTEA